ncbi:YtxH domain-containing protein [Arthrobacter sp. NPDC057259]|uniref:YtxH domain-containing protein n=1 Tax=Arthrobacter sp. NPDC057259 TaxID=3346073 RepID=UPI0036352D57
MKNKLVFGTGLAAGYILGSRSGRAAYEKLKTRASELWQSKPVQDGVTAATEAVKDKAPEVTGQLAEAARRAGTVITSKVHHDGSAGDGATKTSNAATREDTATAEPTGAVPAHSTHVGTPNLGTDEAPKHVTPN